MGQTFVALYDNPEDAEQAVAALHEANFTEGEIRIVTPEDFVQSKPLSTDILGISGMVKPEVGEYEEAVRNGSYLVAVTSKDPDVARAEAVLLRFEPVHIDQKVAQWKTNGWTNPYDAVREQRSMDIYDKARVQTGRDRSSATVRVFVW